VSSQFVRPQHRPQDRRIGFHRAACTGPYAVALPNMRRA
jgi:hypothetical protein